jgi:hypothetical protein
MGGSKQDGELYRVVKKDGTHLAESKDTSDALQRKLGKGLLERKKRKTHPRNTRPEPPKFWR